MAMNIVPIKSLRKWTFNIFYSFGESAFSTFSLYATVWSKMRNCQNLEKIGFSSMGCRAALDQKN